jgi:hypothetical protein
MKIGGPAIHHAPQTCFALPPKMSAVPLRPVFANGARALFSKSLVVLQRRQVLSAMSF